MNYADMTPQQQHAHDLRDRINSCCQHDCDSDPAEDALDGTNGLYCEAMVEHTNEVRCDSHGGSFEAPCAVCLHVTHHDEDCSQPAAIAAYERRRKAGYTIGEDS